MQKQTQQFQIIRINKLKEQQKHKILKNVLKLVRSNNYRTYKQHSKNAIMLAIYSA